MRKGYKIIEVYFPDAEYDAFLKKVRRTNLSISEFVRRMAAEQVIRDAPHADVPLLIREVKRVGNNINQLLFLANSKGFFDTAILQCIGAFAKDAQKHSQHLTQCPSAGRRDQANGHESHGCM